MNVEKIIIGDKLSLDGDVFITKNKGFRHINVTNAMKGTKICPVCMEVHKNLKSHHIINARLKTKNKFLEELRIKICEECHRKLHPENKYIRACKKLVAIMKDITDNEEDKIEEVKEIKKLFAKDGICLDMNNAEDD